MGDADERKTQRDPFSGPLASITGRLQKLRENNVHLQYGDVTSRDQLEGIFFEIGMLIDLLDELTGKVCDHLFCDGVTERGETP